MPKEDFVYDPADPQSPYEMDELLDMLEKDPEKLQRFVGFGAAASATGQMGFLHHSKGILDAEGEMRVKEVTIDRPEHMAPLAAPIQRSDIERVASLSQKIVAHYREFGTLDLPEDVVSGILGIAAKAGRADLTGEDIKQIAQHFLVKGEAMNEESAKQNKIAELDRKMREGDYHPILADAKPKPNRAQRRAMKKAAKNERTRSNTRTKGKA